MFPRDDYTPHGYLDLPEHTRRLTPKGVVRSHGVGFLWHYPAYAASYGGRREIYRAGFRFGLDGALALSGFDRAVSSYHSKNLVTFNVERGGASAEAEFHLAGSDVLAARLRARPERRLSIHFEYTRLLSADGGWGESGLVGRRQGELLVLQGFEDGEAFALWTSQPATDLGATPDGCIAETWAGGAAPGLPVDAFVTALGERGETVSLHGVLGFDTGGEVEMRALLARGRTVDEAIQRLKMARQTAEAERAAKLEQDARFWSAAPRLEGDWPDHWRRGLVYDLETLRMMVRPPAGIYANRWDAMQIQAPRVVLGEAAIDALLLGYADPETAQEVLLGTFADAPAPNVPCSREDGSYNMVSADGSVCGTGPQWGYPWWVARHLYALRPDREWLERLYPHLAAYLDWWLAHRRDPEGWLVHACSWESGQDLSPRFGEQPLGGGHPTWSTRPVDLQASFAHAATTMADLAAELGRERDKETWRDLARAFTERTESLWNGRRYADMDTASGALTEVDDVMLLSPLALGVASHERADRLRPGVRAVDADAVTWPMYAWTAVEAAAAAGEAEVAAALAHAVVDRAYRFWDARVADEGRTLPGVSCEYWPLSGRCGGEGYGWGAFTTHLVLGALAGFSPERDGFRLRPNLPVPWRRPGRRYGVRLNCRGRALEIKLRPLDEHGLEIEVNGRAARIAWGEALAFDWREV